MSSIDIVLDGKLFAARTWESIPRIGEVLILKQGTVWAQVTQVVWGDSTRSAYSVLHPNDTQWIQLLCKTIDPPKGVLL